MFTFHSASVLFAESDITTLPSWAAKPYALARHEVNSTPQTPAGYCVAEKHADRKGPRKDDEQTKVKLKISNHVLKSASFRAGRFKT